MKYKIVFKPDFVEIVLSDKFDLSDYESLVRSIINHESWKPGTKIFIDARDVNFTTFDNFNIIVKYAETTYQFKERLGNIKKATVFNDRRLIAPFCLQKLIRENLGYKINSQYFADYELALKWLKNL